MTYRFGSGNSRKKLLILLIVGFILAGPLAGTSLSLQIDGPALPTGSWNQGFIEHNVGFFDTLEVKMDSPDSAAFEASVFLGFSVPDWEVTASGPDLRAASASGPQTATLQFTLHFAGELSDPLALDFWAYEGGLGGVIKESARLAWSGDPLQEWTITYNYDDPHCVALVVPLPGAVLLLGAGLVRLAAHTRRKSFVEGGDISKV